jgi:hypothetical protein
MERAAAAAEVVRLLRQRADAGVRPLTPEFVTVEVDWSRRLAEAVCESSGADRPRQVAAVEEHVRRARRARDVAQERHRRGLDASEVAAHMAAYAAAEAELWLDKVWAGTGGGGGGDRTGR